MSLPTLSALVGGGKSPTSLHLKTHAPWGLRKSHAKSIWSVSLLLEGNVIMQYIVIVSFRGKFGQVAFSSSNPAITEDRDLSVVQAHIRESWKEIPGKPEASWEVSSVCVVPADGSVYHV